MNEKETTLRHVLQCAGAAFVGITVFLAFLTVVCYIGMEVLPDGWFLPDYSLKQEAQWYGWPVMIGMFGMLGMGIYLGAMVLEIGSRKKKSQ